MKKIGLLLILAVLLALFAGCTPAETAKEAFAFRTGETEIALGADYAALSEKIGACRSAESSPSCAFEGYDKIFVYDGYEITTYPEKGKDYVLKITLTDDSRATAEGLKIGDTVAKAKEIYGDPDGETENCLQYKKGETTLNVFYRESAVSSIRYVLNK